MILYLATTNPGKLRDFEQAMQLSMGANPGFEIQPLPQLATLPAPDETADTFAGNAALKAISYSLHAPGQLVLADDSGLEVNALNDAPGVRSARYADDRGFKTNRPLPPDQRNNLCLLDALASTRESERSARYHCALCVAKDGSIVAMADGSVEGEILAVPRGSAGFGYDPLFLVTDEGQTMAELPPTLRQAHSHRRRALKSLLSKLQATA